MVKSQTMKKSQTQAGDLNEGIQRVIFLIFFVLTSMGATHAQVVQVEDPGEGNDIRPNLEAAWDRASAGATIQLPAGRFRFSGELTLAAYDKPGIHIKGAGSGDNGTRLYRSSETPDYMMKIYGSAGGVDEAEIEISDIWFQAMNTRAYEGDNGTGYPYFRGLAFREAD